MIKFAVCDDEPYMLDDIAAKIIKYMEQKNIPFRLNCFADGNELLNSDIAYDILLLDIQMNGPDGMEVARKLREQGFSGLLIFVTVLRDNVFESFEVQAFDYLVKPMDNSRFERTMERAVNILIQEKGKNIVIQKGNTCQVINFSQIKYCEVLGRKIYFHLQNGETIDYYNKLKELEKLMDSRFFKSHRSYLVNLDYVMGMKNGSVILTDGGEIPVSRLREEEFTRALLDYMKKRRCLNGFI